MLDAALAPLGDDDLERTVTIRQQPMTVHAALVRSLAHLAYHVGQIVLLARIHAAEPLAIHQHSESAMSEAVRRFAGGEKRSRAELTPAGAERRNADLERR